SFGQGEDLFFRYGNEQATLCRIVLCSSAKAAMRRPKILLAMVVLTCALLAGCSLSPFVNADVMDYFEVNDLAANRILLLNILRAKDGASLHFSELSLVRGTVSAGATAGATFPFGPMLHVSS